MLVQTDHYLGKMLAALKELGIEDNTLVVFTADNGPEDPDNGNDLFNGWTGPWAGTYFTGREGFPIFVGNDFYALKWRNWKVHYIWQETKYTPNMVLSTVPKVVNLITDPREERQVAEPYNTWTQYPMMRVLADFQKSVKQYPNVPDCRMKKVGISCAEGLFELRETRCYWKESGNYL